MGQPVSLDSIEAVCEWAWKAYEYPALEIEDLIRAVGRQALGAYDAELLGEEAESRIEAVASALTRLWGICALRLTRFAYWASPGDERLRALLAATSDTSPEESHRDSFVDGSTAPWNGAVLQLGHLGWLADFAESCGGIASEDSGDALAAAAQRVADVASSPVWAAPGEAAKREAARDVIRALIWVPDWEPEREGMLAVHAVLRLYDAYRTYCVHVAALLSCAQRSPDTPANAAVLRLALGSALRVVGSAEEVEAVGRLLWRWGCGEMQ